VINLIWGSSFKRAYKKITAGNPDLKPKIAQALETFADNPLHPSLRIHKLSGKLKGLWAFVVAYDCRVVFQFLDDQDVLRLFSNSPLLLQAKRGNLMPTSEIASSLALLAMTNKQPRCIAN